jgi:Zn-dependent metalloprotease
MTYGDGSGTYFDILTSIDVAAHEIGHAICSNTANLAYQPESGAMNEAFSDIWEPVLNIMRQIYLVNRRRY